MKNANFVLAIGLLLLGSNSLSAAVSSSPRVAVAKSALPEWGYQAFQDGRYEAKAWLNSWRAAGSNQAEYDAELQAANDRESSADPTTTDYYHYFGYRTGLEAYK